MLNWILKIRDNARVRYMMENGDHPVVAEMSLYEALRRLPQNKARTSDVFPGFPLTVDDKFYFEGEAEEVPEIAQNRQNRQKVEIGADGLPIPAGAE